MTADRALDALMELINRLSELSRDESIELRKMLDGRGSEYGPMGHDLFKAVASYMPQDEPDEIESLRGPFRNADDKDWEHLFKMLPDSGHGRFWQAVMTQVRASLEKKW